VPALSALLESANGMEAQPARVDAAVINNAPLTIQAVFAFSAMAFRTSSISTWLTCTPSCGLK
jgi:hypothetical protein